MELTDPFQQNSERLDFSGGGTGEGDDSSSDRGLRLVALEAWTWGRVDERDLLLRSDLKLGRGAKEHEHLERFGKSQERSCDSAGRPKSWSALTDPVRYSRAAACRDVQLSNGKLDFWNERASK